MFFKIRYEVIFYHTENLFKVTLLTIFGIELEKTFWADIKITVETAMNREVVLTDMVET